MAKPQCEDGYTRIANELLDAMCHLRLQQNQWIVLLAIARKTYGWNKKKDWITGTQIAHMTGLRRQRVYEALKALQSRRIILRDGRLTGIQKDYTMWLDVTSRRYKELTRANVTPVTSKRVKNDTPKRTYKRQERNYTKDRGEIHPAIQIYAELTGKKPRRNSLQYDRIVRTVDTTRIALERWRDVLEAWLLSDYKPTNLRGMLEWFKHGIPVGKTAKEAQDAEAAKREEQERIQRDLKAYHLRHGISDT